MAINKESRENNGSDSSSEYTETLLSSMHGIVMNTLYSAEYVPTNVPFAVLIVTTEFMVGNFISHTSFRVKYSTFKGEQRRNRA